MARVLYEHKETFYHSIDFGVIYNKALVVLGTAVAENPELKYCQIVIRIEQVDDRQYLYASLKDPYAPSWGMYAWLLAVFAVCFLVALPHI